MKTAMECMRIADKYAGHFTIEQKLKKLAEEIIELSMSLSRIDMDNVEQTNHAQNELGDCLFVLLHINHVQFDGLDPMILLNVAADKMIFRNTPQTTYNEQ